MCCRVEINPKGDIVVWTPSAFWYLLLDDHNYNIKQFLQVKRSSTGFDAKQSGQLVMRYMARLLYDLISSQHTRVQICSNILWSNPASRPRVLALWHMNKIKGLVRRQAGLLSKKVIVQAYPNAGQVLPPSISHSTFKHLSMGNMKLPLFVLMNDINHGTSLHK